MKFLRRHWYHVSAFIGLFVVSVLVCGIGAMLIEPAAANTTTSPLRVALVQGNLAQASRDPTTGEYRGVTIDVARELGLRLGRPIEISMSSPAAILDGVAKGEIDLGFVAPNPDRVGVVSFSQAYMLVQQSAIIAARSTISSVKELDRPGQRIGANTGDSVAGFLSRNLREATVAQSSDVTMAEALSWLETGAVAAFAGNRQRLGVVIRDKPSFRLLPDNIYSVPQAVAVSLSEPALLEKVNEELSNMRASGFLDQAVQASGVDGINAAPAP